METRKPDDSPLCECCGEKPGSVTQGPWPLPISTCHCNDCYTLEGVAYAVWRELNPTVHKFQAPVPFLKGKQDYPPESLAGHGPGKLEALKEWFRQHNEKLQRG